jgi:cellulose synthase/poly-beta-1,6-N-acetylglucosamine synthase-like glycosyltransferase
MILDTALVVPDVITLASTLSTAAMCAATAVPPVLTLAPAVQALAVAILPERPRLLAGPRPGILVLTPAHDEAAGIRVLVEHIRGELSPGDRHLVVADNCSDDTAALAAAAGAEVIVRTDPARRGKGHALAAGLRAMGNPPDVVIFIDADCRLEPGSIDILASSAHELQRPVQALDLMRGGGGSALAEFAWLLRNDLRPSGYARLGLPCQLLGTGMALPARLAKAELFETGALAEDLMIGLRAALAGSPPLFERGAIVISAFPTTESGMVSQKRRWVHGHLDIMRKLTFPTLAHGIARRDPALVAMALDIVVPPLSLLAAMHGAVLLMGTMFGILTDDWTPSLIALTGVMMFALFIAIGFARHGRGRLGWRDAAGAARHGLRVASFGLRFLARDRSGWTRADRSSRSSRTP